MNFKKSLLFLTGTISTVASIATFVSCGETTKPTRIFDNSFVDTRKEEVANAKKDNKVFDFNTVLLTAGGTVQDKSFNQSIWEAVQDHYIQIGKTGREDRVSQETKNQSELIGKYKNFLSGKQNVWILTGFQQGIEFPSFLKQKAPDGKTYAELLSDKNVIIIAVDWDLSNEDKNLIKPGHFISLLYKTEEAGYIAGYAASKFLAYKFPSDETKRTISPFGGGHGAGVTDFIAGFLAGIAKYNTDNPTAKVKIADNTINIDTGFEANTTTSTLINNLVSKSTLIFPVAGSLTSSVVDSIKKSTDTTKYLIGVDTDQSKALSPATAFFTSVEKRLGRTIFEVLTDIYLKKEDSSFLGSFRSFKLTNPANATVYKGISDDFVGVSNSTVAEADKAKAQEFLNQATANFKTQIQANPTNYKSVLGIPTMLINENAAKDNEKALNELIKKINGTTTTTA
ncbi:BMP family ABC transporter substrate-binding protein [Mesomycoplasma hyorhinis]|uniref:BMP family ABC transporter substrate-binding protein n=1 Tax=Mesomycoplasma hyorhinis TaxID=2100 RepID=UPI001C054BA2|nr:BMP family ABC transporter substrate-binding protein [Mesomycoplasma hyorhinis]